MQLHRRTNLKSKESLMNGFAPLSIVNLKSIALFASVAALLSIQSAAAGTTDTWSGGATGTWSTGSWTGDAPPTTADDATFAGATALTITMGGNEVADGLVINNTSTTALAGGSLTLGGDGLTIASTAGQFSQGTTTMVIGATQTWANNSALGYSALNNGFSASTLSTAATLTLTGTGSGGFNLRGGLADGTGGGALTLTVAGGQGVTYNNTAANTYTGGTNIQSGSIREGTVNQIGTGLLTLGSTGGNANLQVVASGTITNNVTNAGTGTNYLAVSAGGATDTYTGTFTLNNTTNALELGETASSGGTTTFYLNGLIQGSGGLVLVNLGSQGLIVNIAGANTYSGGTTVNQGTLNVTNATGLGTGAVTVAAGKALNYFNNTDAQLALGSTLAISSSSTTIGATLGATSTSSEINVTGAATATTGAVKVNLYANNGEAGAAPQSSYTLIAGGAGSTLNGATSYSLGLIYNDTNFSVGAFTKTASALTVATTSATALTSAYWTGSLTGQTTVWAVSNGTASNWAATSGGLSSAQALVPGSGATVYIASGASTPSTGLTLGANMSIAGLVINDTNGLGLNADTNTLTIGSGGITVNSSVTTASNIAANLALGAAQTWANGGGTYGLNFSGNLGGSGALILQANGSGVITLSGASINNAGTITNSGTSTGTTTISGALGGSVTGVTENSSGSKLVLSGSNPLFTGGVTVTTGTVSLGSTSALDASNAVTVNGGVFDIAANAETIAGINGSGGTVTNSGVSKTLTIGGIGNYSYTGTVTATTPANLTLVKTGTGTQTLGGTDTYTGTTSVTGGTLEFATPSSLYNSVATNWTAAKISVGNGATLAFGVGAGGFTASQISGMNLFTAATTTAGFEAGSSIGFDTTGATGGNFTYSSVIANSAAGAVGLSKLGTSALTLSNTGGSTYSGGTSVSGGKLYVTNTTGSGTGSGSVTVTNSGTVLAGTGKVSGAVTLAAGTTLYSGGVPTGTPVVSANTATSTTGITLSSSLGVNSANLTFALGTDTTSGAGANNFAHPSYNSTYMSAGGVITFSGSDSISLVDLTNTTGSNGTLTLRSGTPYLLIYDSLGDAGFSGLVTVTGTGANAVYSLDQNGYVVGVAGAGWVSTDGASNTTAIQINQFGADGATALTAGPNGIYSAPVLYLQNGNLEVVPEPGTWALMVGGLALLIVIQRRRHKQG